MVARKKKDIAQKPSLLEQAIAAEQRPVTPLGFSHKEYGEHKYAGQDGTSDCGYYCGCWAGPSRSGGPLGLEPIGGKCPGNPLDGKFLGGGAYHKHPARPLVPNNPGSQDYEYVVMERIARAEGLNYHLMQLLKKTDPDKIALAQELEKAQNEMRGLRTAISQINEIAKMNAKQ